jgi:hypothetical protein
MQQEARNAPPVRGLTPLVGLGVDSEAEDYVPSSSDPEATDLPTANSPQQD